MKDLQTRCYGANFTIDGGDTAGGIVIELIFGEGEPVFIRNVFLARRGIDKDARFATAFGYDPANVIEGQPPEAYQFRVGLYVHQNGQLVRGDANTALRVTPPATLNYVLPIAKIVVDYFADAPEGDLFLVIAHPDGMETHVKYGQVLPLLREAKRLGTAGDPPVDLAVELKVPFKETPTGQALADAFTQTIHAGHPKE